MQNNWYTVYTRSHCERKVSLSLTRKNIENYCPVIHKKYRQLFRNTILNEPLFKSYVFVKTSEEEIYKLSKEVNGVISCLFWKGKPATIKEEEINAIKDFTKYHEEISVEKMHVSNGNVDSGISYLMEGQILLIKNRTMQLTLPSLGLRMVAKCEELGIMGREISFGNKDLISQS
ncbi:MAG: transcription termination/antitermination NusG family protein [Ginsengibacter sp.]